MRLEELYLILKATGYPVAYSHFEENQTPPNPPFITYLVSGTSNFNADNQVYKRIDDVNIELYIKRKDLEAEKKLEDVLNENELVWDATENYIESEKIYQRIYEVRLI